jgi:Xaa-Pro aminopeptidase
MNKLIAPTLLSLDDVTLALDELRMHKTPRELEEIEALVGSAVRGAGESLP